jgi:hypothetical protein
MIGVYFRGRLGNNMYQYAYIRSVSERLNLEFTIHESPQGNFEQFDDIFPHLNYKKNVGSFTKMLEEINYDFKEDLYYLKDDTIAYGFFQNHMYSQREKVKIWFQIFLDDNQEEELKSIVNNFSPDEYCYINFRGTDFMDVISWQTNKDFFERAKNQTKRKKYLVITDDIENAKINIEADIYINPNFKIALKLMTLSKELIIPAWTSFGWWGAWLSESEKIWAPDITDICYNKNDVFTYI